MRRRGFLHAAFGTVLAFLGIGRAQAQGSPSATSGAAATWQYRWHDGLKAHQPVPRPKGVPTEFVPAGDHQKHKTQHWVRPKDWPLGPAVQSQNGEVISVDYMIAKTDFERGFSWSLVYPPGLRHLQVDHIDIDLVPEGHTGFETPHYDMHVYFVNHGAHGACEM